MQGKPENFAIQHPIIERMEAPNMTLNKDKQVVVEDEQIQLIRLKRLTTIGQVLVGILFVALWEILTKFGIIDSYYWSSPSTIVQTTYVSFTEGTLLQDLIYTSGATIIGFAAGTFLGSILGLSFWWSSLYSNIAEPYLIAFNAIPKLALAPVLVIMFGIGFFQR